MNLSNCHTELLYTVVSQNHESEESEDNAGGLRGACMKLCNGWTHGKVGIEFVRNSFEKLARDTI
jgi:hypothetical protein